MVHVPDQTLDHKMKLVDSESESTQGSSRKSKEEDSMSDSTQQLLSEIEKLSQQQRESSASSSGSRFNSCSSGKNTKV